MINNYSFNLDRERDVLIHGTAHYSKNWTKADQKEYNHWYYINKIKNKITGDGYKQEAEQQNQLAEKYSQIADNEYELFVKFMMEEGELDRKKLDAQDNVRMSEVYKRIYGLDFDEDYISANHGGQTAYRVDSLKKATKKAKDATKQYRDVEKASDKHKKMSRAYVKKAMDARTASEIANNLYKIDSLAGNIESAVDETKKKVSKGYTNLKSKFTPDKSQLH